MGNEPGSCGCGCGCGCSCVVSSSLEAEEAAAAVAAGSPVVELVESMDSHSSISKIDGA